REASAAQPTSTRNASKAVRRLARNESKLVRRGKSATRNQTGKRSNVAITRRELITNIGKAGVPVAVAMTVGTQALQAEELSVPSEPLSLLYDASLCIGC